MLVGNVNTVDEYFLGKEVPSNIQLDGFPIEFDGFIQVNQHAINFMSVELFRFFWRCFHHRWKVRGHSAMFQINLVNC